MREFFKLACCKRVFFADSQYIAPPLHFKMGKKGMKARKSKAQYWISFGKDMSGRLEEDTFGKAWAKVESNRALGYSGNSGRSKWRRDNEARDRNSSP